MMNTGLSNEFRELRRQLLSHNGPDVADSMAKSGYEDPVRLIIEMTNEVGTQLSCAAPKNGPMVTFILTLSSELQ